jgi:glucose-6-phosphate 1-epimerase
MTSASFSQTPIIQNSTAAGSFAIHTAGAHVTQWDSSEFGPLIFTSAHSAFTPGKAIRGGIPLCFPWFGAGRAGNQTPSHGFARTSQWRALSSSQDASGTWEASFELRPSDLTTDDRASFPHDFAATFAARFTAQELSVSLTVSNAGTASFSYEEALHTYFAVADVRQTHVSGLQPAAYFDKVTGQACAPSSTVVTFGAEVDRVYESTAATVIVDSAHSRRLTVTKQNSAQTVVWNPGPDLAGSMSDLGDDEWTEFVCVETANVGNSAVTLAPGESHSMSAHYAVSAI